MRRLLFLLFVIFLIYYFWSDIQTLKPQHFEETADRITSELNELNNNEQVNEAKEQFKHIIAYLQEWMDDTLYNNDSDSMDAIPPPVLDTPDEQIFSIHNIEIGEKRLEVEKQLGAPKRSSVNEYGVEWHTYHTDYQNFLMVSYDKNDYAVAIYTNQDLISSSKKIALNSSKEDVRNQLGEPLSGIRKGRIIYQMEKNGEYDQFNIDDSFVTIFYDKHENNSVTAIQIVHKDLEQSKESFYADSNKQLADGLAFQLFDLTNATRVNHGLPVLSWDEAVKATALKHSKDMAEHDYFSHTNLAGQSPFDRMLEDDIPYRAAGENLAAGQVSSIFAHEGLMNSKGHRKNILQDRFEFLGVGVAFNKDAVPYYTENFFSD